MMGVINFLFTFVGRGEISGETEGVGVIKILVTQMKMYPTPTPPPTHNY